ncbi:MAG: pilus assembly protein N-terminal domain-containing protein [Deltaproteobacteria bacterium]|nr:pilus assembly protein N-terminal domain-containing protein [Deltaproteobacteria bacterium]
MRRSFALMVAAGALCLLLAPQALAQKKDKSTAGDQPPNTHVDAPQELNMAIGENKTIKATDVKNYSEGIPGIADVKLSTDGNQFVIVGQKPGSTTLLLIKKDGSQVNWTINVFARSPDSVEREVQQLLEGTTGVRVRRVGSRFFIEGGVTTEADAKRIQQIATLYPGQVESLVVVGSAAAERKVNIRIDFFFIQYDRRSSYGVGISWPSRIGGDAIQSQFTYDFLAGATTTAQASIVNQPLPGLDIASRHGWAKVLKQSTVITTNGSEATFESGGEQNFPVSSGLVATIQKIPFGTSVTVLPRYDTASRDLEIRIHADVADLVPSVSSTPLPGRNTSKLSTLVHMKLGQSLVLSGIRTRSQRHDVSGIPGLSRIPLLGLFFGSHSDLKEDVEGAVFVIPSVVESVPNNTLDMIKSAMSQYQEYDGDVEGINAYNKRPPKVDDPPAAEPTDDKARAK